MEKVLTAEEFLETKTLSLSKDMYEGYNIPYSYLESLLVEFARIHVERAIKSSNLFINGNKSGSHSYISEKLKISIYNDYLLTNIK